MTGASQLRCTGETGGCRRCLEKDLECVYRLCRINSAPTPPCSTEDRDQQDTSKSRAQLSPNTKDSDMLNSSVEENVPGSGYNESDFAEQIISPSLFNFGKDADFSWVDIETFFTHGK